MRHGKDTVKLGRTSSHRDSMFVNMLKSLIENKRISTTLPKAKELRRRADQMITIAKKEDKIAQKREKAGQTAADAKRDAAVIARREAVSALRICYNTLTSKEAKAAKAGDTSSYSRDRTVIGTLFGELKERFATRNGGYTRIIRTYDRVGDSAPVCFIEYV